MKKEKETKKENESNFLICCISVLTCILLFPYFATMSLITDKGIMTQIIELDENLQKLCKRETR